MENITIRHAEKSDAAAIRAVYACPNAYAGTLQLPLPSTDKWMNIKRIELTVYTDNHAAIGLYKKFGFVMEGESKDFAFRNGEFVSVYHMARLQ